MRICFIGQEDIVRPQGGTGTYVRNISLTLARRGHEVHVISRRRNDASHDVVESVQVHRVDAPGPAVLYSPLFFRASRRKFMQLHTQQPFEVLHGNLPLMSSYGVRGKDLPPVVETLHCTVREELKFISRQTARSLNLNEVLAHALSQIWLMREGYLLRRAEHVIAVSEGLKREIVSQYDYPVESIQVIPNGVDYGRFARVSVEDAAEVRASLGIQPYEKVILYLGRLMERKRVVDLVRALPRVLESVPGARLVVVGKRNANAERIEALAQQMGVRERVTMIDHVPYAEVPRYYALADLYCLPSAYEGFPFTVLEAMASGTPVVASNIPGIDEQIVHGENGFLHEVGNTDLLSHYLARVLQEPSLAARLSESGRKTVRERYDWSVIGDRTEASILSITGAKGSAASQMTSPRFLPDFTRGS